MATNLLAVGNGRFEVRKIYYTRKDGSALQSSKGDPMISIMFEVCDANNLIGTIYEYFTPKTDWKAETLFKAVGMPEGFDAEFTDTNWDNLIGCKGDCKIATNSHPDYPAKSVISKFIYQKESKKTEPELDPMPDDDLSDICPF